MFLLVNFPPLYHHYPLLICLFNFIRQHLLFMFINYQSLKAIVSEAQEPLFDCKSIIHIILLRIQMYQLLFLQIGLNNIWRLYTCFCLFIVLLEESIKNQLLLPNNTSYFVIAVVFYSFCLPLIDWMKVKMVAKLSICYL